ncbi:hypothetical protein BD413DRAFT_501804 [Trametes elegans]|nr:hypothetical protein BD413DRAFT_501804 [Trametes elegans]
MGREVMSAYRRRKYTTSVSPSRSSATSSMESLADTTVNLTPQRKHHKLLKDGSEVWSKEVEKIFVDGLRQYWQSPWATYSRGRSRWRNQFLVDHLKRAGVERTKKQVASHIQVLRNMWRGTPEFHLVAGGEELFQENGLLAHTNSKPSLPVSDTSSAHKHDLPEPVVGSSSASSSPEFTALDFPLELQTATSFPTIPPTAHMSSFSDLAVDDVLGTAVSTLADHGYGALSSSPHSAPLAPLNVKLEPLAMDPTLFTLPPGPFAESPLASDFSGVALPNRILNLHFWAEGMVPLSVDVGRLVSSTPSMPARIFLHFKVLLPPVADLRCPPGLQGVSGAVSFASRWASLAKCQTKSWGANRTVLSQDIGLFSQVTTPELQAGLNADAYSPQMVFAYLPDSALSRCHWLETVKTVTQQIVVDNEVLAVLAFHIERVADAARTAPAMELIGFQTYPWRGATGPATGPPSGAQAQQLPHLHHHHFVSPPVSPTSATFPTEYASAPVSPTSATFPAEYASAPVSPTSPMFPHAAVASPAGVDGMMPYHFQHPFGYHSR